MAKIGILGGTFNPIHNGHLRLAESAYKSLSLDKVLIMPSGISYLKMDENVLPKHIRAEMVKIAIYNHPEFEFSDIEINKEGNSYTYETLIDLKKLYPDDDLYFIIGADTLFNIESWKCIDKIFSNCILAVMQRDDSSTSDIENRCLYLKDKYKAKSVILNVEKIDISSTNIRESIKNGTYNVTSNLLPFKVYEYILNNSLYRG